MDGTGFESAGPTGLSSGDAPLCILVVGVYRGSFRLVESRTALTFLFLAFSYATALALGPAAE